MQIVSMVYLKRRTRLLAEFETYLLTEHKLVDVSLLTKLMIHSVFFTCHRGGGKPPRQETHIRNPQGKEPIPYPPLQQTK